MTPCLATSLAQAKPAGRARRPRSQAQHRPAAIPAAILLAAGALVPGPGAQAQAPLALAVTAWGSPAGPLLAGRALPLDETERCPIRGAAAALCEPAPR